MVQGWVSFRGARHHNYTWSQLQRTGVFFAQRLIHSSVLLSKDYYEILNVGKNATQSELKNAFYELAKKHHPDMHEGQCEVEKKFQEISEAYGVLKDNQERAAYDQMGHDVYLQNKGSGGFGSYEGSAKQSVMSNLKTRFYKEGFRTFIIVDGSFREQDADYIGTGAICVDEYGNILLVSSKSYTSCKQNFGLKVLTTFSEVLAVRDGMKLMISPVVRYPVLLCSDCESVVMNIAKLQSHKPYEPKEPYKAVYMEILSLLSMYPAKICWVSSTMTKSADYLCVAARVKFNVKDFRSSGKKLREMYVEGLSPKRIMHDGDVELAKTMPQEQRRIVKELNYQAVSNLKEGNLYYVVCAKWFKGWQRYAGQDDVACGMNGSSPDLLTEVDRPGYIDNSDLVLSVSDDGGIELIRTLEEGQDYVLVPEEVWEKLLEWYKGGPPLPRMLISGGATNKKFNVEVYPLALKLIDCRDGSKSNICLSRKASLLDLYGKICALKGLSQYEIHIWDFFNEKKQRILVPSSETLENADLQMDQHILLEVKADGESSSGPAVTSAGNELALTPIDPSRSTVTFAGGPSFSIGYATRYRSNMYSGLSSCSTMKNDSHGSIGSQRMKEEGGLAGSQNLGNTCFMNSAFQYLVCTTPHAKFFLKDYTDDLNKQNLLGMNGKLSIAFGELLRELWLSGWTSIAPRQFKGKLARFAPQFCGT